ncbi:hypothetical protein BH20ACT20_BH20ACT20_11590 [soil metagenome]
METTQLRYGRFVLLLRPLAWLTHTRRPDAATD